MLTRDELPAPIADMLAQLGGPQIFRMAFATATHAVAGEGEAPEAASLTLRIAPDLARAGMTRGKCTHVVVRLGWDDVYEVEVLRYRARGSTPWVTLEKIPGVYADALRATVERATGILLTLGTMRAPRA